MVTTTNSTDPSGCRHSRLRVLINRMSSLTLCAVLMAALVIWLGIGILLTYYPATAPVIKSMNDRLILSWLLTSAAPYPLVCFWMAILFGLSGLLLINLTCCCFVQPAMKVRFKNNRKPLLLLVLHILVGLVMILHVANMTIGFKAANIKLLPGQSAGLPDGKSIRLESINCTFSKHLAYSTHKQIRKELTRDRVDLKDNYVDFSIHENGKVLETGRTFFLLPFRQDSLRITLNRFFPVTKPCLPGSNKTSVGAVITAAENPLHELFFVIYAAMIICFLAYWIVSGAKDKNIKKGP